MQVIDSIKIIPHKIKECVQKKIPTHCKKIQKTTESLYEYYLYNFLYFHPMAGNYIF